MNISLTEELEDFVKVQVNSGHYTSASEVVREALREKVRTHTERQLDRRLQESRDSYNAGSFIVADDAYFAKKEARIRDQYMNNNK
tara:strand:- start:162 stop:419 length:258 start_codon:yes stop_codon:yes gene_type:complete